MKIFLPSTHPQWPQAARILEEVSISDPASISSGDLRDFLFSMHELFSTRPSGRKFDDVPRMMDSLPEEVASQFLHVTLPHMCRSVLTDIQKQASDGSAWIPFLSRNEATTVSFTPWQAFILIALSFFCIPLVMESNSDVALDGTCHLLFTDQPKIVNKLHCLVNYFNIVVAARTGQLDSVVAGSIIGDDRSITVERLVSVDFHGSEWWAQSEAPLVKVDLRGLFERIESFPDAVHADFANKHLGGGVLRKGCVQEEIRFMVSPECLLSVFLCESMAENEAVIIQNTLQFNTYSGYGSSFKCLGFSSGLLSLLKGDTQSVVLDDVICFDAIPFGPEAPTQFRLHNILRELEKCRAALSFYGVKPFATGNWGCGVFGGDTQLKAVIQWLAASVAKRPIIYFPFDDEYTSRLPDLVTIAQQQEHTVGSIFRLILRGLVSGDIRACSTIDFLLKELRTQKG